MQTQNLAVFCDLDNLAIGTREANLGDFDVDLVMSRLLDKGDIIVKRAYCDWSNWKKLKKPMHEAAFELIEIPHVSYSGKNSADIHMVVDAIDLSHTNIHVDTYVLLTGDSDFSPLVSKLREMNRQVIGMGVKHTSSRLLVENCDEYIYYDDLCVQPGGTDPDESVMHVVLDQVEALFRERNSNVLASLLKQTIKRKRPNFQESAHGYRNFSELLEDASAKGLLKIRKDNRAGGYLVTGFGPNA